MEGATVSPSPASTSSQVTKASRHPKSTMSSQQWKLLEDFDTNVNNGNFDNETIQDVCSFLKSHGKSLDEGGKRLQLDCFFNEYRNLIRGNQLDLLSKCLLLEVIELRASKWIPNSAGEFYADLRKRLQPQRNDSSSESPSESSTGQTPKKSILKSTSTSTANVAAQASVAFNSTANTKNNLMKEELVIRNSDSGKVMGIKGRRVKMIEEISDTIISFQRVVPGAKDRLLQITGTRKEALDKAKQLILDTILRNTSPIPDQEIPAPTRIPSAREQRMQSGGLQRSSSMGHALIKKDFTMYENVPTGNPDQLLRVSSNSPAILAEAVQALKSHFELKKSLKKYLPEFEFDFDDSCESSEPEESEKESEGDVIDRTRNQRESTSDLESFDYVQLKSKPRLLQSIVAPCDLSSSPEPDVSEISLKQSPIGIVDNNGTMKTSIEGGISPKKPLLSYDKEFLLKCSSSDLSRAFPECLDQMRNTLTDIFVGEPPVKQWSVENRSS